jgi:hypothetical protein
MMAPGANSPYVIRKSPQGSDDALLRYLWAVIVAAVIVRALVGATTPLIDDEAYYWLWARHLDWSYLDHPPMVAYLLALTTSFGSSQLWIRLGPLLLGAGTSYALFLLGRELFGSRAGFIAAVLFQLIPVLAGSGLLATPDAPLFLAWTVALRWVWLALHGQPNRWTGAGIALGFGLLSKLYMVFLVLGVVSFVLIYARRWLARPGPYVALAIASVLFVPVIYWNLMHQWAMVRFILHERPAGTPLGLAGIGEILIQQFAFALLLAPALIYALYAAWRRRNDERYAYLFWTAVPTVAATIAFASTAGAPHGNWFGPAYLGLTVVLGALWNRLIGVLAVASGAIVAFGFVAPFIPTLPPVPGAEEIYGWEEAARRVQHERATLSAAAVIVADRYQVAAQLAYYTRASIPVTMVPCPNPASIWPRGDDFNEKDAIAILDARWTPKVKWEQFAERVEEVTPFEVAWHGRPLRTFRIWRLHRFSLPPECRSASMDGHDSKHWSAIELACGSRRCSRSDWLHATSPSEHAQSPD